MDAQVKELAASAGVDAAGLQKEIEGMQKRILDIQMGKAKPPAWFARLSFDEATVDLNELGTVKMVAATAGTMDALDRADEKTEADIEMDAVVESIASLPDTIKLRRPLKIGTKTHNAGTHFENLWDVYAENRATARLILKALLGGRAYQMIKMGMVWLSKIDMQVMLGMDPEEGGGATGRPTD